MQHVQVGAESIERFIPLIGRERVEAVTAEAVRLRALLGPAVIWNINSTSKGGGVAELLRPLVGYARGVGVDCRWAVIDAPRSFFDVTKRLHHALHGSPGDGRPLDAHARATYEAGLRPNAVALAQLIRHGDVVILHDPQVAGLAIPLAWMGARIIWRCHIGRDEPNEEVERAWNFLLPYLVPVHRFVFTRRAFVPPAIPVDRTEILPPTIDPFAPKNEELAPDCVHAILARIGVIAATPETDHCAPSYLHADGTPGRVDNRALVIRDGNPPPVDRPLVVQVSRWDPLKDPLGVMNAFARLVPLLHSPRPDLVLAAADVRAVADDPEGARTFEEVIDARAALAPNIRSRVHLVSLPMHDVEENGVMVNALQRHAAVVVQKSLTEGFGLTVTEAMWKARPVVASAVGGIRDQIDDGISGLLLRDPKDLDGCTQLLARVLTDPALAQRLGAAARERVREHFLGITSLLGYARILHATTETWASGHPHEALAQAQVGA